MYTKGDWKFERSDLTIRSLDFRNGSQMGDYRGIIIADLKPALGCDYSDNVDLEHTGRSHAVPQTLANAHLISAAPKMYEACKYVVRELDKAGIIKADSIFMESVNRAISKAEGKAPH